MPLMSLNTIPVFYIQAMDASRPPKVRERKKPTPNPPRRPGPSIEPCPLGYCVAGPVFRTPEHLSRPSVRCYVRYHMNEE